MSENKTILVGYLFVYNNIYNINNKIDNLLIEIFDLTEDYELDTYRTVQSLDIVVLNETDNISRLYLSFDIDLYSCVTQLEEFIQSDPDFLNRVKVYDSYKLKQNQDFLREFYNIEMKIREIFSVICYLQNINIDLSRVNFRRDLHRYSDEMKKSMVNELAS